MNVNPTRVCNKYARKRQKCPEKWKLNVAKRLRYSPKSLPCRVCEHNTKNLQCSTLLMKDLQKVHSKFYEKRNKKNQDIMLFKFCLIKPVKYRANYKGKKKFTIKYSVFIHNKRVPICQKFFLNIFDIKKYRIEYLMKKFYETGEFISEGRGGDRKAAKFADQKESVHKFIQSLNCIESHYCRRTKHAERKYLPSELNIKKLYYIYKNSEHSHRQVKLSYFRYIINNYYNLGFGTPKTDVCSKCLELSERIKIENDINNRNILITEKRVHSLRAKAFYDKLKDTTPGVKIISFDCQKNLPLPKLPDQICYYSRQLYFYNLSIVEGSSNSPLTKDRIFSYYCTENELLKDSNLIASAVYDRLCKTNKVGIKTIRLIADGCGGQNKNSIVIGMCCKWLLENLNIKTIEIVFPVTGHSFMPADRVFGIIEKKLRKLEIILHPNEIKEVIGENATLVRLGTECPVYDWRAAVKNTVKSTTSWNVKFNECKRFVLKRSKKNGNVLVRGETLYKSDLGTPQSICQPHKLITMINPTELPNNVPINKNKLKDIDKLSKHFGPEWKNSPSLSFYKDLMTSQQTLEYAPQEESYCDEALEDASDLHI